MTEYVEALLKIEQLTEALKCIKAWPQFAAGIAECELSDKHVMEWHDMGGTWYCSRCHAGTYVRPLKGNNDQTN